MNHRDRHRIELDRREVLVILAALRSFTHPEATDFSDEFLGAAADLIDRLRETGVES